MNENSYVEELLAFFKALSDPNRLKIVALLAKEALSVEQLAEILGLSSSTVSHHLSRLAKVKLVDARAEGYYSVYQLRFDALKEMAQRVLSQEMLPTVAAAVDADAYDRKVLKTFLSPDGRLLAFPAQQKKEQAILRHINQAFERNRRYSEKEVNEILLRFSDDSARLRRNLVEYGLMAREGGGGAYWRVDGDSQAELRKEELPGE
ncbi:MAG: metalloregulator ArsR/SmtB family transcription factor [Coprothermobacterota bacterium]|nr:metalloregulator ArsR/SmtB family transcription factor [Coprothermobacterota bacterium]